MKLRSAIMTVGLAPALIVWSPASAQADYNVPVANQQVIVVQDGMCTSGLFGVYVDNIVNSIAVYMLEDGTARAVCEFADIGVYPTKTQRLTGFGCLAGGSYTEDTWAVLTPTGRLTFSCLIVGNTA